MDCGMGMKFEDSTNGVIWSNIFMRCEGYAIENDGMCEDLLFHSNAFIRNNKATGTEWNSKTAQIMERSMDNSFDLNGTGNYYSEHTSPDEEFDGIVDEEYYFHGVGQTDEYPLTRIPIPTFDAPDIHSITPGVSSVTLEWTTPEERYGGDLEGYRIYMREGDRPYSLLPAISLFNSTTVGSLTDGSKYSFMVSAFNYMGEGLLSAPVSTVPDGTGPEIEILSPVEGSFLNDDVIELEWFCIEKESAISRTSISIDGGEFFDGEGGAGTFEMESLEEGDHTVVVRSFNTLGLMSEKAVNFTVDRSSPYLVFDDPGPLYSNTGSFEISWAADDNLSGLENQGRLFILDEPPEDLDASIFDIQLDDEGEYKVLICLRDIAGNTHCAEILLIVDLTLPEITLYPKTGHLSNQNSLLVNWICDGTGSPIDTVQISLDRGRPFFQNEGPGLFNDLEDGEHILSFYITDMAGNGASAEIRYEVDTTAPGIEFIDPSDVDVPLNSTLEIVFSEDIFNVSVSIENQPFQIRTKGNKISISPDPSWEIGTEYNIEIMAKDRAGNDLQNGSYTFRTVDRGKLSGRLLDEKGSPITGASIIVEGIEYRSDSEGRFSMELPEGEHFVLIKAGGFLEWNFTTSLSPGIEDDRGDIILMEKENESVDLPVAAIAITLLLIALAITLAVLFILVFKRNKRGLNYDDMAAMKEIMSGFGIRRSPKEINCYEILGIPRRARESEIRKAYRNLAARYHPDRKTENGQDPESDEKMREINAAKTILLDPEKREVHDRMLNHFQ
jgi:hypothetical protein